MYNGGTVGVKTVRRTRAEGTDPSHIPLTNCTGTSSQYNKQVLLANCLFLLMVLSGPPRGSVGPGAKYRFGGPDDIIMYKSGTRVY